MAALLEIKDLSVDFKTSTETVNALRNISFKVNKNEIVALVGESGSGKSVTSLSILQLVPAPPAIYSSGEIVFHGSNNSATDLLKADRKTLQKIRGNKIGMIFQEPMTSLNPVLTCGKQVAETLQLHKNISKQEAKEGVINWFRKVKLPDPEKIYSRYPHELSGGQKQRVMIAMAMCCEPDLLICDEPTTALDVTVQKTVLQLITELQQQSGMGVIFITHDLGVVAEIADRALVMYRGEIVEQNIIREIFLNPQHKYTRALLACRPADQPKGKRLPVISDFMLLPDTIEKSETSAAKNATAPSQEVLLKVQDLSVWFPAEKTFFGKPSKFIKAVNNVSFDLYKGETLGLVGESGCGKTTLGRTLLRLVEPHSGSILYNGTDLLSISKKELISRRKEMQIIFQDPYSSLNPRISIGSAIAEPMKVHGIHSRRQLKEKVAELLQKVDLSPDHYNRYPHEFSGGQRQRIVIARSLALNPSFIVCDESVSALDVSVQAQVLNLLNDLKREFGFTVIFISHDLSVIRYISDRIMVMSNGEIVETGKAEDIYQHPSSDYTRQLIASVPKGYVA
ncbi:MAG TPA: ABC transporter ATP-binding protein [Chitinophagaceae bacterium]|nr:ABC transporter ATP-binding protein [Chitinophagaceae bacterium]